MVKSAYGPHVGCPSQHPQDNWWQFGLNDAFGGVLAAPGWPAHALQEVKNTSKIFLVADCTIYYPNDPAHFDQVVDASLSGYHRHGGKGLNFVFVDGHGEWVKVGKPLPSSPWRTDNTPVLQWGWYGAWVIWGE